MSEKFPTPEQSKEEEQTREEIESSIKKAFEEYLLCDLVIENEGGQESSVPNLLIEEIEGENLMITYIAEDGDLGEGIPLNLNSVKDVHLKEPYQEKK